MPIYTIYADANDGDIKNSDPTYATANSLSPLIADVTTIGDDLAVGNSDEGEAYKISQAFLEFDTSSVVGAPASASLQLYINNHRADSGAWTLNAYDHDWGGGTLTASDFRTSAQLGSLTVVASIASGSMADDVYNSLTENGSNFLNALNLSGDTRLVLAASTQGTAPPSNLQFNDAAFNATDQGANFPKLVVTVPSDDDWIFVGISDAVIDTSGDFTLVETGISGCSRAI